MANINYYKGNKVLMVTEGYEDNHKAGMYLPEVAEWAGIDKPLKIVRVEEDPEYDYVGIYCETE